jgi:cell division protein FtsZ
MGVGDEDIGNIAVTIITGLILNNKWNCKYRPKKIIHTLEDEQRSVHNLSQNTVQAVRFECRESSC